MPAATAQAPAQEVPVRNGSEKSQVEELKITPIHTYFYNMIELGIVRTLAERGIFQAIPPRGDISVQELAEKTDTERALLSRFIKFLIPADVLASPAPGRVAHTPKSETFLIPSATIYLMHGFDYFMGPATRWSEYFSENGFTEPQSSYRTPIGLFAGYPDKSLYEIMPLLPNKKVAAFNRAMAGSLAEMPILGYYDFSWISKHACVKADPKRTLIVDVGGGKGQALKAVLEQNPEIHRGRCVLQDQAKAINEAIAEEDVVIKDVGKVISSFFEPQLIKGALVYQIRRVINDWSDKDAQVILQHVRDACADDSIVLVSEQVLPDEPSLDLAAMDLFMMNFGGKRRTRAMFEDLAGRAGLRVVSISSDEASGQAMVEMVPA